MDFHIHSTFSDGTLEPYQLLLECSKKRIKKIGVCDHWGTSKYSEKFQVMDIEQYVRTWDELRSKFPEIEIFIGLEVDFSHKYGIEPDSYDYQQLNKVDYILFEHVNTEAVEGNIVNGRRLEELIKIRDKLKIPIGLAHNHFQSNFPDIEETITKLKSNNIFLELCEAEDKGKKVVDKVLLQQMMEIKKNFNSAFEISSMIEKMKKENNNQTVRMKHAEDNLYFFEHFTENTWQSIKKHKLGLSISSDSHKGLEIGKSNKVSQFIEKFGLENQLIFNA